MVAGKPFNPYMLRSMKENLCKVHLIAGLCSLFFLLPLSVTLAQQARHYSSADIALELQRLNVLGTVLYVAAHPDDENTRLITYFANEKKYRTGYLSLTRGDGGQNLVGPDIREKLGIIRTQELLQARRIDRGEQFFSRANDFGYSKHPDETFATWNRDQVLADMVYVIRTFKPDVIITRFNTQAGTTHGHHTASAILASEAFEAAADPSRFPEQLQRTEAWQPTRLLWNTSSWFYSNKEDFDTSGMLAIDVGIYNPLLGKSYTEIAAESRSMHKSQGFGAPLQRGSSIEYLQPLKGEKPQEHIMEGVPTDWSRLKEGESVGQLVQEAIAAYNPQQPAAIVPRLLEIYKAIQALPDQPYKETKLQQTKRLIQAAAGLYLEVAAEEASAVPGDSLGVLVEAVNRSAASIYLKEISFPSLKQHFSVDLSLENNQKLEQQLSLFLAESLPVSQPYWLEKEQEKGMFVVEDKQRIGMAENPAALEARVSLLVEGVEIPFQLPVVYKYTEPAEGEIYQPFALIPPVGVSPKTNKMLFANGAPQELAVEVIAGKKNVNGTLSLMLPSGWTAEPAAVAYSLPQKGERKTFRFQVSAPGKASEAELQAVATYNGTSYSRGIEFINYKHIPTQLMLSPATVKLVKMDLALGGKNIGYLMGAGDEVPESLRQVGYQVDILLPEQLEARRLKKYDAVVLGIRAFNTIEALKFRKKALEDYARKGGVVIIQYNTSFGLVDEAIAPFPLQLSRDRVTVEEAPVQILQPAHPVFNQPNRISAKDFDGWVQERGLYFAGEWSQEWTPLLASNDPGEEPLKGGLLLAPVGEGSYVYTGYSWFRQLPAGVPGAFRLFANLLDLGKN